MTPEERQTRQGAAINHVYVPPDGFYLPIEHVGNGPALKQMVWAGIILAGCAALAVVWCLN